MDSKKIDQLRIQLSVEAKNGIDFTFAATIIWAAIAVIWQLDYSAYNKSIFVFIAGGPLLPMAFLFSKLFKTNWKAKDNPLQPLGLWFNFAQLFYFPFLIFTMLKMPEYFVLVYAIITGAHFFPYAWFYKTKWYAIFAGIIAVGSLLLSLKLEVNMQYYIPAFTSLSLLLLTTLLFFDSRTKSKKL